MWFYWLSLQFEEDILEEISSFTSSSPLSPQSISEALCSRAKAVIENRRVERDNDEGGSGQAWASPFARKAESCGLVFQGAKNDGEFSVYVSLGLTCHILFNE